MRTHLSIPLLLSLAASLLACGTTTPTGAVPDDAGEAADAASIPDDAGATSSDPDAGSADAGSTATVKPLGSVTVQAASIACPNGAATGATCQRVTVSCPGISDLDAVVAVTQPSGTAKGTLFAHKGGAGTAFYTTSIDSYVQAGLRVVQVAWLSDWEQTQDKGIKDAACRPATLMKWAWTTAHGGSRTAAFCGVGHSGGSGVLAYSLAHYGMGEYLDYAALTAGPPFGRLDYGCAPQTYMGPQRTLCPELPDAPLALPDKVDGWENTTTCGSSSPDPAELLRWREDSVVSTGASYAYPKTRVTFWDCATQPNGTTGGAFVYSREITTSKQVTCFTACQGEALGQAGDAALRQDLFAGCVPRH